MKNLINLMLLLSTVCFAQKEMYTIKGTIKNFDKGTWKNSDSDYIFMKGDDFIDSTLIKDGKFNFKGQVSAPTEFYFTTRNFNETGYFYIENSDFEFEMVEHSNERNLYFRKTAGRSETQEFKDQIVSFYETALNDVDFKIKLYQKVDSLIAIYPRNPASGDMLAALSEEGVLSPTQIENLYTKLDLEFQTDENQNTILNSIKKYSKWKVGAVLPAILLPDEKGNTINTAALDSEYTFIEFWFVNCGPCIKAIPEFKDIYKQFNSKNVEFVQIAIQENKPSWDNALIKYDMPWPNLICLNETTNETIQSLEIDSFPSSFLIDKNNKILALNLEPSQLKNKLLELTTVKP